MTDPLKTQIGGDHYKKMPLQPVEIWHKNKLDAFQGAIIKYIFRHKSKNGKQDLEKAKHFLDLYIGFEYPETEKAFYKKDGKTLFETLEEVKAYKEFTPIFEKLNPGHKVGDFDKHESDTRKKMERRMEIEDILREADLEEREGCLFPSKICHWKRLGECRLRPVECPYKPSEKTGTE